MPQERQRAVPGADQRRAGESFPRDKGSSVLNRPASDAVLFLQRAAGNRAATRVLLGYLTPRATWGAFPGHPLTDIQSGQGVVHNALLLADTERTVVRGPFRPLVKPPWFVTNRTAAVTGRRLTAFAARPQWSALSGIFASAMRG